ncbi:phosphoribosylformylglycinamidine synthase [Candidatus Peregrinibacteria bacterium]|nr:phosphoribosylformylglycinamidine synthase [Candidatus Peregrinibacteria bacterium]
MIHRIEIANHKKDSRAHALQSRLKEEGILTDDVAVVDTYLIEKEFSTKELVKIASALTNPILQRAVIDNFIAPKEFNFALEIGFLPGVTDNVGSTAKQIVEDLLKVSFGNDEGVYTSQVYFFKGALTREDVEKVGKLKANELIQRVTIKDFAAFQKDSGMGKAVPRVKLIDVKTITVNLNVSDEELVRIGKEGVKGVEGRRGPLALDLASLHAIRDYFKKEKRSPSDVELESLAQTWSEHCKHTIFANKMDRLEEGLYKGLIKRATNDIRAQKGKEDFCVSVFTDNAGGIVFDDDWVITDKAETHNSPSALDPFGGAVTGIVGVNRDALGFGMGAKPVINRYGFCFADPHKPNDLYRAKEKKNPSLPPRKIMDGVIEGVNAGGNRSGIPTPQGFMIFDDRYRGKPLVFVGTVGLIPRELAGKPSWKKGARPGDKIVMTGGRVGQDGIHGATFSSEAMDTGSPATAVQIGDPITQKKLSDAIVKEARDQGLYNSITDNGAGGLSCSVAEMARECGGCFVELDKVPLKYPSLEPWKIWISESQERMTLAVPPAKVDAFISLMARRGVEAAVIGEFRDNGRCTVTYKGYKVMDIDLAFLHDGAPGKNLRSLYHKPKRSDPDVAAPENLNDTLTSMLGRLNIAGQEFLSMQYDHEVQAGSVIKPLQGKGRVNGEATVVRPLLTSERAAVLSQGLHPGYSDIDTYWMAAASIDTAIRNAIAVGGNLDHMALMDNFCWCSSDEAQRLGELKSAVQACYDYATQYGTPFISGKDSMFNDFKGYDADGKPIKVSVPPTLLISSLSVIPDANKCVTLDPKVAGDLVYVLGATRKELGGSEYYVMQGVLGNTVPHVNAQRAQVLYRSLFQATQKELIASCMSVNLGGLGVALAKMVIAGELGLDIDLRAVSKEGIARDDHLLFSETQSRFIVTINLSKKELFEVLFGRDASLIGTVTSEPKLRITGLQGNPIVDIEIAALGDSYRKTFRSY